LFEGNNMPKRSAAAREPFVEDAARVATARKEQLIRQTVQLGRRRTEAELKMNLETAEAAGITWAPYQILDELKHWPNWLRRADWEQPKSMKELSLHIEPDDGDDDLELDKPERVDFTWQGVRFNIVQREQHFGEFAFAQVTLDVDWNEVMDVTLSSKVGGDVQAWRVSSVDTLRAGPWMAKLADLFGLVRIEQERGRKKLG
jgi:hypothetical protein